MKQTQTGFHLSDTTDLFLNSTDSYFLWRAFTEENAEFSACLDDRTLVGCHCGQPWSGVTVTHLQQQVRARGCWARSGAGRGWPSGTGRHHRWERRRGRWAVTPSTVTRCSVGNQQGHTGGLRAPSSQLLHSAQVWSRQSSCSTALPVLVAFPSSFLNNPEESPARYCGSGLATVWEQLNSIKNSFHCTEKWTNTTII